MSLHRATTLSPSQEPQIPSFNLNIDNQMDVASDSSSQESSNSVNTNATTPTTLLSSSLLLDKSKIQNVSSKSITISPVKVEEERPLASPSSTSSASSEVPIAIQLHNKKRSRKENEIEEMDSTVRNLLDSISGSVEKINNGDLKIATELLPLLDNMEQTLLRMNLNKNLIKYQLKSNQEEFNIERQLYMKSLSNFERNNQILKNENEMINLKNLKLIKYCRSLKNDKKSKKLKLENLQLRAELDQLLIRSKNDELIDTYKNTNTNTNNNANDNNNNNNNSNDEIFDEEDDFDDGVDMKQQTKFKRYSNSSKRSSESDNDQPISIHRARSISGVGNSINMLDTLGRLASHVLEDEEFKATTQ
ncbi:hypothetical protein CANARDRAFT_8851 [[Candida] arabinofermentans NRRL YB-2248]|uniref:Uncharacterized protein n=1 Tax=[Candida] arabinofermentans NRRL YB-2248 TaxID=983967 RepID=A0A1E4SXE9_9ASCO|nr:hypothetical protein CANARDRAFT_8851 [[Candida] arabinofermentans NRRL YB-2248]